MSCTKYFKGHGSVVGPRKARGIGISYLHEGGTTCGASKCRLKRCSTSADGRTLTQGMNKIVHIAMESALEADQHTKTNFGFLPSHHDSSPSSSAYTSTSAIIVRAGMVTQIGKPP